MIEDDDVLPSFNLALDDDESVLSGPSTLIFALASRGQYVYMREMINLADSNCARRHLPSHNVWGHARFASSAKAMMKHMVSGR